MWSNFCVNNVHWVIQFLDICTDIEASAAYIQCRLGELVFKTLSNEVLLLRHLAIPLDENGTIAFMML